MFITLPSLLFFAFVYFKYNEELPKGIQGEAADQLAQKMLVNLNHQAYENTGYIEFTFKKRHHFKWNKAENTCEVYWKDYKVFLDFDDASQNKVFKNETKIENDQDEFIKKAIDLFNNDTFWLVAPYKVFDPGTERRLVTNDQGGQSLLVTYTSGGSTPGDSYLWHFDRNSKPKSFQMWVDIIPIGGLEASWSDWKTTETGAELPTYHQFLFLDLEITDLITDH